MDVPIYSPVRTGCDADEIAHRLAISSRTTVKRDCAGIFEMRLIAARVF
jgi:hypothetical protein